MVYQDYSKFLHKSSKIIDKVESKLRIAFKENSEFYMYCDEEASEDAQAMSTLSYSDDKIIFIFSVLLRDYKLYYNYHYTNLMTNTNKESLYIPIKKLKKDNIFNTINKLYNLT